MGSQLLLLQILRVALPCLQAMVYSVSRAVKSSRSCALERFCRGRHKSDLTAASQSVVVNGESGLTTGRDINTMYPLSNQAPALQWTTQGNCRPSLSGCVLGVYRKFEELRSMVGSSLSVDGLCEQELLKGTAMGKHTHVF